MSTLELPALSCSMIGPGEGTDAYNLMCAILLLLLPHIEDNCTYLPDELWYGMHWPWSRALHLSLPTVSKTTYFE